MSGDVSENPGPDLESISTVTGNTCSLSILHLNIRSIRNKINYIEENFNDFDILCFTETHLGDTVSNDDIYIEGFHLVPYSKDVSPHSSGILVYASQELATIRKPELECHLEESLWIEIFHRGESRKENPQKLTQLSSRSHPRHLVGKRTAQKDITIDTTSDSQVNSNFPNRWSPAQVVTGESILLSTIYRSPITPVSFGIDSIL